MQVTSQGRRHIAEPAGLGERCDLRGDQADFQRGQIQGLGRWFYRVFSDTMVRKIEMLSR